MIRNSRTAETYDLLKRRILDGEHLPREKLRIDQLAETLSVSQGAVREALSRLTSDGLVVAEPQRGFVVAPISIADLTDLTDVRIEIDTKCLRRSIEIGDVAWEARILSTHHQLSRMPRPENPSDMSNGAWSVFHGDYHDALVAACDSLWWLRLRAQLFVQAERYRRLTLPFATAHRDVTSEHRAIMEATLDRDTETACGLLANHIRRTADILLASQAPFDDAPKRRTKPS